MRLVISIALGILGGFLIYFESAMVLADFRSSDGRSALFVYVTFLGGWALTSYMMVKGTKTISKVISRGFLIGAALWLLMIPVGLIFSGKAIEASDAQSGAEATGAAIGVWQFAMLTGGLSIVMCIVCLIGFAITYFLGREMKPDVEGNTKTCPECAEVIQEEARKCRFCGAIFA